MAEAKAASGFQSSAKRGVDLAYNREGMHFKLAFTIPPPATIARRVAALARSAWRSFLDFLL